MISLSPALLLLFASPMACRKEPSPLSLVLVTIKVCNTELKADIASTWNARGASIKPVVASNTQSPPKSLLPVKSSEAAISASLISPRRLIKACPPSPSATLQPYKRISPSSLRASSHCCNWLSWLSIFPLSRFVLPSCRLAESPWDWDLAPNL